LAELEDALASARPGLVLLVGGPSTGKGRLLKELRARATAYPCTLMPADHSPDAGEPWLVVSKQSTVDDFRQLIAPASEAGATQEYSERKNLEVVLVYGYRPEDDFHRWFTGEFLTGLAGGSAPRMVVVAGSPDDLSGLEPLADRRVMLKPLPREAVVAELREISAMIADSLQEQELELYADAIVADPSMYAALRHLLLLTPATQPANPPAEEE
jgi:hypothetical protein